MTPKEREVMELALEKAFELGKKFCEPTSSDYFHENVNAELTRLIEKTQEALARPEQEPVEDLQAKLKWATEKLEADINWEFVAAAKEEMLKAAWAEIKELREQTKELREQEPVAWLKTWNSAGHARTGMQRVDLTPECETWLANMFPTIVPLYTTPPQRKECKKCSRNSN